MLQRVRIRPPYACHTRASKCARSFLGKLDGVIGVGSFGGMSAADEAAVAHVQAVLHVWLAQGDPGITEVNASVGEFARGIFILRVHLAAVGKHGYELNFWGGRLVLDGSE